MTTTTNYRQLAGLEAAPAHSQSSNGASKRSAFVAVPATQLIEDHPCLRPPIIEGLLREGETANIVSATKVGKSWLTLNLVLAVAHGLPWLGHWTKRGKVLLVDNELHPETLASRLRTVAEAMGVDVPDNLVVVSLRGRLATVDDIGRFLDENVKPGEFSLIAFDALYRMLPEGTSENDNAQMASVFNELDRIAGRTRAAVACVHHVTKGPQGEKRATDVGSGAGSMSRAVDCHLVLREHEEPGVFVMDAAVRSFPPAGRARSCPGPFRVVARRSQCTSSVHGSGTRNPWPRSTTSN